jgi:hypothetical protein
VPTSERPFNPPPESHNFAATNRASFIHDVPPWAFRCSLLPQNRCRDPRWRQPDLGVGRTTLKAPSLPFPESWMRRSEDRHHRRTQGRRPGLRLQRQISLTGAAGGEFSLLFECLAGDVTIKERFCFLDAAVRSTTICLRAVAMIGRRKALSR